MWKGYRERARSFVAGITGAADAGHGQKTKAQPERRAARDWIVALDHALQCVTGKGLSYWTQLDPLDDDPLEHRHRCGPWV